MLNILNIYVLRSCRRSCNLRSCHFQARQRFRRCRQTLCTGRHRLRRYRQRLRNACQWLRRCRQPFRRHKPCVELPAHRFGDVANRFGGTNLRSAAQTLGRRCEPRAALQTLVLTGHLTPRPHLKKEGEPRHPFWRGNLIQSKKKRPNCRVQLGLFFYRCCRQTLTGG